MRPQGSGKPPPRADSARAQTFPRPHGRVHRRPAPVQEAPPRSSVPFGHSSRSSLPASRASALDGTLKRSFFGSGPHARGALHAARRPAAARPPRASQAGPPVLSKATHAGGVTALQMSHAQAFPSAPAAQPGERSSRQGCAGDCPRLPPQSAVPAPLVRSGSRGRKVSHDARARPADDPAQLGKTR